LALTHGQCDINSGSTYQDNLLKAVAAETEGLKMADVDRALRNSFKQRFDLGLFDPEAAYKWPGRDNIGTDANHALSLRASRESMVLLRNDASSVLPLPKASKVAVVGPHAAAKELLVQPYPSMVSHFPAPMIWCPDNTTDCIQSPFEAIAKINHQSAGSGGWTKTEPGCDVFEESQDGFEAALALAKEADYVVLGLGISTCGPDSPVATSICYKHKSTADYDEQDRYMEMEAHDRTEIVLPPVQQAFAKAVLALGKPTVIFLLNAGAVDIDNIAAHAGPAPLAIIEAMYPGQRGAQALAEGIFGEMNAWGRLPFTIYPASFAKDTPMTEHDLRVSPGRTYRYYRQPTYAFGTGLSLTNWSLGGTAPSCLAQLETAAPAKGCTVTLLLKNSGSRAGDSVILAYFRAVRSDAEWMVRRGSTDARGNTLLAPLKQLYNFTRVKDLAAGASSSVEFVVTPDSLGEVDEQNGDRVSEPGSYELMFEGGGGELVTLVATVRGERAVLDPFPSQSA
jgi:hypothetical protein